MVTSRTIARPITTPAADEPAYDGPIQTVSVVVPVYFNAETMPMLAATPLW